jgi:OFA family oxalate/formate antiporter-like MFS transporter
MVRGPFRPADRRGRRWRLRRLRLDSQFLRDFALAVVLGAAALAGIGAGAVYGTCVGNALKWFPDLRGLAAGLTAAGFGAGAAATVIPIREMILGYGYEAAFLWVGLGQGLVIVLLSRLLRAPRPGETPKPAIRLTHSLRDHTPRKFYGHRCSGCSISCS